VFTDAQLTFCQHVRRVTSSCFFHPRRLRQIHNHINRQVMKQLVQSFVISRLDYCNGTVAGLPMRLLGHLQQVQNATTTQGLQPRNYIKPALFKLHWLPVHLRIQYKLCLLIHSVTVQCCPSYISNIVHNTAASSRRHRLRSSTDNLSYTVPPT